MVTHEILCKQLGENSTTPPDPIAVWKGQVDLNTTTTVCLYSDDDTLVEKKLYRVIKVELPDWLSPEEWIERQVDFKYLWGFGCEKDWPESWQRRLLKFGGAERLALIKLLRVKNFRSGFRKDLRVQLEAWLAQENPKHSSPFSSRQWDCVVTRHDVIEARRIEHDLYWRGRYE